jgi:hypothetical protein
MRCPFCEQPIGRNNAWKGTADRFYCSEFCADSECVIPSRQQSLKDRFDRQYLARLERLVALRQQQGESLLSPPGIFPLLTGLQFLEHCLISDWPQF